MRDAVRRFVRRQGASAWIAMAGLAPFAIMGIISSWYGIRTATGYSPQPVRWAALLDAVNPTIDRRNWPSSIDTLEQAIAGGDILDRLGVRYLLLPQSVPDPLLRGWSVIDQSVGGAVVARTTALLRVRWAPTSVVVAPDPQVAALAAGVDPTTVVLDSPSGAAEAGQGEAVGIDEVDGDERTYRVQADGSGYLVLADATTRGGR